MSFRSLLRRAVVGTAAVAAFAVATPAVASAASTLQITPCNAAGCTPASTTFPAAGSPSFTTTIGFDTTQAQPSSVTVELAPGVLASASANTACLLAATYTGACKIGGGAISTDVPNPTPPPTLVSTPFDAYLVPSKSGGLAGIDLTPAGLTTPVLAHGEVGVRQLSTGAAAGAVVMDLVLDLSKVPAPPATFHITGATLNVNGTLNGQPFTRMPTNCTPPAGTGLSVVYGTGATATTQSAAAVPDVTPTGCSALNYSPGFTATAVRDTGDPGVAITTDITQGATDAASKSTVLSVPLGTFAPNAAILGVACSAADASTCPASSKVGTVTATSPLLPIGLSGNVYVTISGGAPGLAIVLLTPFKVILSGTIGLSNPVNTTFASIPDIPLTDLKVSLSGGSNAAFTTSCSPQSSAITATFGGQNGVNRVVAAPVTVQNCPAVVIPPAAGPPTLGSFSLAGLAARKPKIKFSVNGGINGAPKLKTISFGGLNRGLGLSGKAISHKKCTGKGKKRKCKKTLTVKGLSLSGATLADAKVSGGSLVLSLKGAVSSATVTVFGPLLTETKALQKKAKKHKAKDLKATVKVTDATSKTTSLKLKLS